MLDVRSGQNKGQLFSVDFLISVIVIILVITVLQVHQRNIRNEIDHQREVIYRDTLISKTDVLLNFEGIPNNWNVDNVEVPGLSTGQPNTINETKVESFFELEDNEIREMLGLRGNNFYLSIEDEDGEEYSAGSKEWSDADSVYNIDRRATLDSSEKKAYLKLVVW